MKKTITVTAPKLYTWTKKDGYQEIHPFWWKIRNWLKGYRG